MRRLALPLLLAIPGLGLGQGGAPAELLESLESRLLQARLVRIEASIQATGAISASLQGFTELRDRNRAHFSYTGALAGKPVTLTASSDGRRLELANADRAGTLVVGPQSNRALVLGLTRMGLLHNLARGAGLAGPDHADGGLSSWISADGFRPVTFAQDGELAGLASLGFDLLVDGKPVAEVQLWLDPDSGLPRRREQVVMFAQGEMKVVEIYSRFVVE